MKAIYKFIATISVFIRSFYLSNPFVNCENGVLINFWVGIILGPITYGVVRLYYRGGTMPAVGSILYLFFYIVHTGLVMLC